MIADKDPFVGRALDLLLPELEIDPGELLAAARADAAGLRAARRRRQTVLVVAFATLLLLTGAAVAAQKLDLLSFLHTNDRNSARFSVSPSRAYHGAAPLALNCPDARTGRFVCHPASPLKSGKRTYQLAMRTNKVPLLTRQSMVAALDRAQAHGGDPSQIARVRSDLAHVGDDFIRALAVLIRIETVGGPSSVSSGTERVPPRGVPEWVACHELTLATYSCRPLAALVGVASGTPLYNLLPNSDWRRVKMPPPENPDAFERQLERLLGRKPTADEERFFIDMATVGSGSGSSGGTGPTHGALIGVGGARAAALLAPQYLGVRTRGGSAVAQPLPRRLPRGLPRRGNLRLYRVTFRIVRTDGIDRAGRYTLSVYVSHLTKLGVWQVVWVGTKP